MVQLRKLILNLIDELPNNTSWRFVDAGYVFPDATNPWVEEFPEVSSFNNLSAAQTNVDFVAVKIGDVNGSAQANSGFGGAEERSVGDMTFNVEDRVLNADEIVSIEFNVNELDVQGYQFTLDFGSSLEFIDIETNIAQADNFGLTMAGEGKITTSWNSAERFDGEQNMFNLVFQATEDVKLSEVLAITSQYTKAEAYNQGGELLDVVLEFNGTATPFVLYQNEPNPFQESTVIRFNLPETSNATLTVMDAAGKLLKRVDGEFNKGENTISLERRDLGTSAGVLYYQLETPNHTSTKKMIVLN